VVKLAVDAEHRRAIATVDGMVLSHTERGEGEGAVILPGLLSELDINLIHGRQECAKGFRRVRDGIKQDLSLHAAHAELGVDHRQLAETLNHPVKGATLGAQDRHLAEVMASRRVNVWLPCGHEEPTVFHFIYKGSDRTQNQGWGVDTPILFASSSS
jgi:hypothetical protein